VAIPVIFPVTRQPVIAVPWIQRLVIGKGHDHSSQICLQCLPVLAFRFALEVPLELAGAFNRPHSD
jgi:hypothetical protein